MELYGPEREKTSLLSARYRVKEEEEEGDSPDVPVMMVPISGCPGSSWTMDLSGSLW